MAPDLTPALTRRVRLTDVSPRDGLQNEPHIIPARDKAALVRALAAAHVDEIEVSSFVSAKWVPQLGDADELFDLLAADPPSHEAAALPLLSALVPNERGLDAALAVNARAKRPLIAKVAVFTAASETFAQRNTNATIAQTLERFAPVVARAHDAGLLVRGYVSCVVACPFEGPIAPAAVARVIERLKALGVDEIDLGDTIGAGTPDTVAAVLHAARDAWGDFAPSTSTFATGAGMLTLHLHDTFARAAACARAALDLRVRSFDASVGGLGGCPYAGTPDRPAPGNLDTRTLLRTLHAANFDAPADLAALDRAANLAHDLLARAHAQAQAQAQPPGGAA